MDGWPRELKPTRPKDIYNIPYSTTQTFLYMLRSSSAGNSNQNMGICSSRTSYCISSACTFEVYCLPRRRPLITTRLALLMDPTIGIKWGYGYAASPTIISPMLVCRESYAVISQFYTKSFRKSRLKILSLRCGLISRERDIL